MRCENPLCRRTFGFTGSGRKKFDLPKRVTPGSGAIHWFAAFAVDERQPPAIDVNQIIQRASPADNSSRSTLHIIRVRWRTSKPRVESLQ